MDKNKYIEFINEINKKNIPKYDSLLNLFKE